MRACVSHACVHDKKLIDLLIKQQKKVLISVENLFSMLINALLLLIVDKSKIYKLLTKLYCMKYKSNLHYIGHSANIGAVDNTEKFHPLSYYLDGGIDLEGEALSKDGDAEFDSEEQAAEIIAEGASSVALGDPRMSKFRLVESLGAKAAAAAKSSAAAAGDNGNGEGAE